MYTNNQLRVLWCLKRNGGKLVVGKRIENIYSFLVDETRMSRISVQNALRQLESNSTVIREYNRPVGGFAGGPHNLLRVSMVDPNMELPACPPPIPLAVVIHRENEEMAERTAHEPTHDAVVEALLNVNDDLRKQINKLHEIVEKQEAEVEELRRKNEKLQAPRTRQVPEHLMGRIKDAVPDDVWEKLRHD